MRLRPGVNPEAHQQVAVSDYREFPVPVQLANTFLCFWTQVIVGSGNYAHHVLPDCCIDIVFINEELPIVVGPWTDPFIAGFAAGTKITGVRLRPGYAPSVLGIPASELLNRSIPLSVLWGGRRTELFARISHKQCLTSRKLALAEVLSGSFSSITPPDETVITGMRWLARHPSGRVEQLSRCVGISERQIHRRFCAALGYGPKMFQSVLRFQRFLCLSQRNRDRQTLADMAAFVGYADQPHMTREVRRFTGSRPTALPDTAKCTLGFSDLLLGN
jgi:AraC-like DNA-binding protein